MFSAYLIKKPVWYNQLYQKNEFQKQRIGLQFFNHKKLGAIHIWYPIFLAIFDLPTNIQFTLEFEAIFTGVTYWNNVRFS